MWKLTAVDFHDRDTWRSGVRSAMCEASHLLPLYLHVYQKSGEDDDKGFFPPKQPQKFRSIIRQN